MSAPTTASQAEIVYPEDDGLPMSDNTKQFLWIYRLFTLLSDRFRERDDVFVAGNLLWYPVKGDVTTCYAPDALVAFGRPKGDRGSYKQWEEDGVAPQVVFEVLSPSNTVKEMNDKRTFYERFGVEEYYVFDPEEQRLEIHTREGSRLRPRRMTGGVWKSPLLGVTFDLTSGEMRFRDEYGELFRELGEVKAAELAERQRADAAERQAKSERRKADAERRRAEAERVKAEAARDQAEAERVKAEAERARAERLAKRLRELGVDPEA